VTQECPGNAKKAGMSTEIFDSSPDDRSGEEKRKAGVSRDKTDDHSEKSKVGTQVEATQREVEPGKTRNNIDPVTVTHPEAGSGQCGQRIG